MTIRPARVEDAFAIARIHVRGWQEGYRGIVPDEYLRTLSIEQGASIWRERLTLDEEPWIWVAHEQDEVVGWLSAAASRDPDADRSIGEIWAIYVDPNHWRKGAGRLLCDCAEEFLREQGFVEATLWVLAENARALKFYGSRGFVVDEDKQQTLERGGKTLLEIRMRKQLAA